MALFSSLHLRTLSHGAEEPGRCLDGNQSSVLKNKLWGCADQVGESSLSVEQVTADCQHVFIQ